jgi:MFS family permease
MEMETARKTFFNTLIASGHEYFRFHADTFRKCFSASLEIRHFRAEPNLRVDAGSNMCAGACQTWCHGILPHVQVNSEYIAATFVLRHRAVRQVSSGRQIICSRGFEGGARVTNDADAGATQKHAAAQEWRTAPFLPFAGLIGHATAVFHINGFSPFIVPVSHEFGWSRTLTTLGLTIILLIQALGSIPIGFLVDRFASRRIGLIGMMSAPLGFALIGTATGSTVNWIVLWLIMGLVAMPVQSTIWTSAISSRFKASRGLALGVSMCGTSLASALFPWFGAVLIERYGWQRAMIYEALIWIAVTYPFMFLTFRGAREIGKRGVVAAPSDVEPGMTLAQCLRSSVYQRLLLAGFLYTFAIPPLIYNFIAIQTDGGIDRMVAAKTAAVIGLASVIGRLSTGLLIDRVNAAKVGAVAFLLPTIGCAILLTQGITTASALSAAVLLGLTQGAELDVFGYLTSRYFGMRKIGSLFGCILFALSLGAGLGPVVASRVFDTQHDYTSFISLTIVITLACSVIMASLPKPVELEGVRQY